MSAPLNLSTRAARIEATRYDPKLFALIYLTDHLRGPDKPDPRDPSRMIPGDITFAECHEEWYELAKKIPFRDKTAQREFRHLFAAPRNTGKSAVWFLLVPMWLAAHGHETFIAAFAASAKQSEEHLATFKHELETNLKIRHDFPDLCAPLRREGGQSAADSRGNYKAASGFVFMARGVESKVLGMKVGRTRPGLILLDDVEPSEESYSPEIAKKRLMTIQDAILPLEERAAVIFVGTVTMEGSIVHQGVKAANGADPEDWIVSANFQCHHHKPIITDEIGNERSIWPEKWPLEYLQSIKGTRDFLKNYANDPRGIGGEFWTGDLIVHGEADPDASVVVLSVDPHVSKTKTSDFTGIAVVSYSRSSRKYFVLYALQTRERGPQLKRLVERLIEKYGVTSIVLETNQGGALFTDPGAPFHGLPVPVLTIHQSESKTVRAEKALNEYIRGGVIHAGTNLDELEIQMQAFPKVQHDDLVDSLTSAILTIKRAATQGQSSRPKARAVQGSYM